MIKPYTFKEIKSKLADFGLSQQWLADKSKISRQMVCALLNDKSCTTTEKKRQMYRLFWTYIINDYAHSLAYEDF